MIRSARPDADVPLDDTFEQSHCFRVQIGEHNHKGQQGLAFSPIAARPDVVDVTGVIWLDPGATRLLSVDFSYTGTGASGARETPRGRIEFRTVANGATFVQRWYMLIPTVTVRAATTSSMNEGLSAGRRGESRTVDDLYVTGGSVATARWRDGSSWSAPPAGIVGHVTEHGPGLPVARAVVSFTGTSDTVSTDTTGWFRSVPMLPGRYAMKIADTSLAAYARDRTDSRIVEVLSDSISEARSELPALSETIAQVCEGPSTSTWTPAVASSSAT